MFSKYSLHALPMHGKLTYRPSSEYIDLAILCGWSADLRRSFAIAASPETWNPRKGVIKTSSSHPVHHQFLHMLGGTRVTDTWLSCQPIVPLQDP
jgi:hypothetical protein